VSAMTRRRRRWILIAVIVAAAAVGGGAWWFFGRGSSGTVRYLTSTAATGTISHTVQSDFTLASDGGVSSISLSGGSSSSTSAATGSSTPASLDGTAASAASTAYAAYAASSPSPSASPSVEPTDTATPTPSPTVTVTPTPSPTNTGFPTPTPSQSSGGSQSGSGELAAGGSSGSGGSASTGSATTSSSVSSGLSGIVTRLSAREGSTPRTLQRLLTVSGKGVFAFVSPSPLWKNLSTGLSSGDQRVNVAVLQRSLKDGGYYHGMVNGKYTAATKRAYKRWQAANGMSKTGIVDVDRFVWMPDGATLSSWSVFLGSRVSGGTELATVSAPTALKAQALVSQSDLGELKVGQKAQMTIDGYTDESFTGVITSISDEPASSSSAGSTTSSGSTQYTITIRPQKLPSVARSGMTGTLEIVLQQHTDVLLVPTSAVTGTSSVSYVRVMQNGTPVVRQVETGMTTSAYTEITSGLAAGETVVTGTYTPGASSSSTTSGTSRSSGVGNLLNGSGGPPAGGMPQGGFPQGGGQ
jgi:hypothetical protein